MQCKATWRGLALVAGALYLGGCGPSAASRPAASAPTEKPAPAAAHDHDAPGKHGGQQQLLGNHEYHAELVCVEKSGEVAIYLSDGQFRPVAASSPEVFLTAMIDGRPKEFRLVAEAKGSGEPRFVLVDGVLCRAILHGEGGVRFNATLQGKPYAATFQASKEHDHDKDHDKDHDHDAHGDTHDAKAAGGSGKAK